MRTLPPFNIDGCASCRCVTGTPINNLTTDLLGQARFLRLEGLLDPAAFQSGLLPVLGKGKATGNPDALAALFFILRRLCIRHTKTMKVKATGAELLELPPKTTATSALDFSGKELAAYTHLEALAKVCHEALHPLVGIPAFIYPLAETSLRTGRVHEHSQQSCNGLVELHQAS